MPSTSFIRRALAILAAALLLAGIPFRASACPFCPPQSPTFAQRREQAEGLLLGEYAERTGDSATFAVRQVLKQPEQAPFSASSITLANADLPEGTARVGQLALLLGEKLADSEPSWEVVPVNELELGYFLRSPNLREPGAKRLEYYSRYLEHADQAIADDAYAEFGRAPFDEVRQVAPTVRARDLRRWLESETTPPERKGLYALLLGLSPEKLAPTNAEYLAKRIEGEARREVKDDDFRAGFDGLVGGYLAATGPAGLDRIDELFLRNASAAEGDCRHIVTALRFAHEYLSTIPREQVAESMRLLLERPGFAPGVIVDLARWRDEGSLELVAAQYENPSGDAVATRRAVVGYLLTLDTPAANEQLATLRKRDPEGVASAERYFEQFGGLGAAALR